ncbi:hypothetical protein BGZ61DRAFT_552415 [Ilyonectria robusta]|uniref:uncharacterized protein n=1 Tax=Ilyonectria robusta TaxID=1079257 RepID=UPI001E8EE77D|nr:uncharacterized protein BGZ61DRAFT_552415 [Ilyonectria robusta]KAH8677025.1 hypothetical protein BGZ61DRAFT_552415 [Ilyonectria robusta]
MTPPTAGDIKYPVQQAQCNCCEFYPSTRSSEGRVSQFSNSPGTAFRQVKTVRSIKRQSDVTSQTNPPPVKRPYLTQTDAQTGPPRHSARFHVRQLSTDEYTTFWRWLGGDIAGRQDWTAAKASRTSVNLALRAQGRVVLTAPFRLSRRRWLPSHRPGVRSSDHTIQARAWQDVVLAVLAFDCVLSVVGCEHCKRQRPQNARAASRSRSF